MEVKNDFSGSKFNQTLNNVEVPDSLIKFAYDVPNIVESNDISSHSNKQKWIKRFVIAITTAASLFLGAIIVSPTFASIVREVPFFGMPVEWLQNNVGNYEGKKVALEHGYSPFTPLSLNMNGNKISIDSMNLEENTLSFIAKIEGDITQNKDVTSFSIEPTDFGEQVPGVVSYDEYVRENTILIESRFHLTEQQVQNFLAGKPSAVHLKVEGFKEEVNMEIPFDHTKLADSMVYNINAEIPISNFDSRIIDTTINKFTISPTSMRVDLNVDVAKKFEVEFAAKIKDFPYITDELGNVYELNKQSKYITTASNPEGNISLEFTPSVYFNNEFPKELTLHLNKAWIITGVEDHYDIVDLDLEIPLTLN
ncbi:DUF4179 domain-containing protein [Fredinandcohnia humi]